MSSYFNQTGTYQVDLDVLNNKIKFLVENGKFDFKNDWIVGRGKYTKLERFRKVQRAYVNLYEQGLPSRLVNTKLKEAKSGGMAGECKFPSAEVALEEALLEAVAELKGLKEI